ncbi:hypothetical protein MKEN_01352400 [Mycena kentingensis (nom. inval.)]|nr:hypothetical protein MKEN_01352400 [Mycena kentingensis (nom. inval.)]
MHFALFYSLLALEYATLARASLYFLQPARGSSCTGGSPCTVRWLDDGNAPLLNAVGVVTAALYTGKMQLVQTLQPVDTANVLSYQFTPIPEAGPNSENYYVAFTSNKAEVNGTRYIGYSPFFTLNGMTGDFDKPLAQATAVIAIPATVSHSAGTILPATITILVLIIVYRVIQHIYLAFHHLVCTLRISLCYSSRCCHYWRVG